MFTEILKSFPALAERQEKSIQQIQKVQAIMKARIDHERYQKYTVYCAGSLGREDFGKKSDLDLFIISTQKTNEIKRLDSLTLFADLIRINRDLDYPEFSNDAQYIEVHAFSDMLDRLGSPL